PLSRAGRAHLRLAASVQAAARPLRPPRRDPRSLPRTRLLPRLLPPAQELVIVKGALRGSVDELAWAIDAHEVLGFDDLIIELAPKTERSLDRLAQALRLRGH